MADLGAGLIDEVVLRKQILFLARSEAGEEMPSGEEGGHVEGNLTIRGSRKRSAPPRPKEEEFRQRARKTGSQVSRSAEAKRSLVANEAKRTKVRSVAAMPSPPAREGSHDGASGAGPWGFPASGADAEPQSALSVAPGLSRRARRAAAAGGGVETSGAAVPGGGGKEEGEEGGALRPASVVGAFGSVESGRYYKRAVMNGLRMTGQSTRSIGPRAAREES